MFKIRPQNRILVPLRGEKCSRYAHRTGSWYLLGVKDVQDTPTEQDLGTSWGLKMFKIRPQNRMRVPLGGEKCSRYAHRTGSWYLLEVKNVQDTPTEQDLGTS